MSAQVAKAQVDRALEQVRRDLADRFPARFSAAFWYGAVDLDPAHLVVWILLTDDPEALPEWLFPDRHRPVDEGIARMRDLVVAGLAREGWPDADHARIGFESDARVAAGGGWHYFR